MANASASCRVLPTMPRMSYSRSVVGSKSCWNAMSHSLFGSWSSGRSVEQLLAVAAQELLHRRPHVRPLQRKGDLRLQEADLVAALEPPPLVAQPMERHLADQLGHRV